MKSIVLSALVFLGFVVNLFSQDFVWATTLGGPSGEGSFNVESDAFGNIYTAGLFDDSLDCDPGPGISMLYGDGDMYVTKQDVNGTLIWAKTIPECFSYSMATDDSGNVYVGGIYGPNVDLDPGPAVYTLPGGYGFFILKLDQNGDFGWAIGGGYPYSFCYSIDVDDSSNILIGGVLDGSVDFDPGAGTTNINSHDGQDGFVAKLTPSGQLLWVEQYDTASVRSVESDAFGNYFVSVGAFDAFWNVSDMLWEYYGKGRYLLKLNNAGNVVWGRRTGVWGKIATDYLGDIYMTGSFSGTEDFDPGWQVYNMTSLGTTDIFITKISQFGDFLWANHFGVTSLECAARDIELDGHENPLITGYYSGAVDFDPGPVVNQKLSNGFKDAFLAKYNGSGNLAWVESFGTAANDESLDIDVDPHGSILITGYYSTANMDADPGVEDSILVNQGNGDAFLIKLVDSTSIIGIETLENQGLVFVYPNPSTEFISLKGINTPLQVELYNMMGELVLNEFVDPNHYSIRIAELNNGMYFLRCVVGSRTLTLKVMKQ